jgi:hypothetical protein
MGAWRTRTNPLLLGETRTLCDFPLLIGEVLRRADLRLRQRARRKAHIRKIGALLGVRSWSKEASDTCTEVSTGGLL